MEDVSKVYYRYSGANWNEPNRNKEADMAYDGVFVIDKIAIQDMDKDSFLASAFNDGYIKIELECENAFYRFKLKEGNIDYIALRLISKVINDYLDNSAFPEKMSFIQ